MEIQTRGLMHRKAMLLGLLGAVSLFAGCGRSAEESFQQGVAAQEAGRLDEAIAAYSAAIESDSQFAMAYFNRGLARLEVEEFEGAVDDLTRTLDLDEENSDALLARGMALHALERHTEALRDFTAALELNELDAEVHRQRAFAWLALGETDVAVIDLAMAFRLEPDRPELYLDRAEVYRQCGDDSSAMLDERLAEFTQKMLESGDTQTRRARGQAFFEIAEYELALADLNAALEQELADEISLFTRGQTLFVLGDLDGALADYTAVVDAGGQCVPDALAARGVLHETREDLEAAIHDYEQAIEASPENDDLLARCAWLLATCQESKLRDGKQALEYGRRACSLTNFGDWFSLDAYAAACAETGDFENATTLQEQALAIAPDDSLQRLQQRLDAYRNHLPYHTGDADSDLRR